MGLQLSGSVQLEGNLLVTGSVNSVFENVLVSGTLVAQEIETQLVSSSIIYSSGSNKFGDLITDKQQFTGSLQVSGSSHNIIGNVGIGSGSISADVIDAGLGLAIVSSTGRTGLTLGSNQTAENEVLGRLSFTNTNSTNIGNKRLAYVSGVRGATNNSAYLEFGTADDGLGSTKMVLDVSGSLALGTGTITNPNDLGRLIEIKRNEPVGVVLFDSRDANPIGLENRGAVFHLTYGTSNIIVADGASANVTVSTGNLVIGTAGKGIDFSTATPDGSGTVTSELLDDYEEGTFTPSFVGINLTINTYGSARNGFYTKVGRLVTVTINIMTESVSVVGSEVVKIGGLPFTAANTAESSNAANIFNSSRWVALPPICGQVALGTTEIQLFSDRGATGAGTDPTTVKTGDMATGSGNRNIVRLTATYFTS